MRKSRYRDFTMTKAALLVALIAGVQMLSAATPQTGESGNPLLHKATFEWITDGWCDKNKAVDI